MNSNNIFRGFTVFWFSATMFVMLFNIGYPEGSQDVLEIGSRMFLLGNIWAVGFMLDLRMKEIIRECFVDFSDGNRLAKQQAEKEKKDNWYDM